MSIQSQSIERRHYCHPYQYLRVQVQEECFFTYMYLCGNKMPTRCNRGFYCRSYCLLNMFRAPLCPSSGARVLYGGCCLWYLVLWFSSCWSDVELRVMCPVCRMQEQAIRSAIKISVASSCHFISIY